MHLNYIILFMNDFLTILKKDLFLLIDKMISDNIINSSFKKFSISIDYLSKSKQGDVSSNIYILIKKNLIDTQFDLNKFIKENLENISYIQKIEIAKVGFVNIFLKNELISSQIKELFKNKDFFGNNNSGLGKKINVEFVSANPTGPIHIAHLRGAVMGDVLSSILSCTGYQVTKEYYVNDAGSQIDILGKSLLKRYYQLFDKDIKISEDEYPGLYLIDLAKKIKENDKDKWLKFDKNKTAEYFKNYAVTELMKLIENDLKSININFNKFTYESAIVKNKLIDKLFSLLNKKKLLYEGYLEKPEGDDNKDWKPRKQLIFKSTNYYDEKDRALKKTDGEWTYFANDAAYHYDKFLRKYSLLINIWGADHIGYINRMKSIVEVFSEKKDFLDVRICQIVRLLKDKKVLKMSKREGNFITLNDLLKFVDYNSIRYFMVSSKNETPMDFDIDKVVSKNKDNPVFYCQYAYARASSVINKSKKYEEFKNLDKLINNFDPSTLSIYEWNLIIKILSWPYLLFQISESKQPHKLTNYLEELSSNFHSFWNMGKDNDTLRLFDLNNKNKTLTKLIWIESFRIVLKRAFNIIGIDAPESM
tara:strand:+ start:1816 stop:3588 length:1773 start_codon:yes stop_codon:yes gene_type:complete